MTRILNSIDVFRSAGDLHENLPLSWYQLHKCAREFFQIGGLQGDFFRTESDQNLMTELQSLSKYTSDQWFALCQVSGWTVYGAVALSWCENAKIEQIWEGWLASEFPFKPALEFERPAKFINPKLLPETNFLSEIGDAFNGKYPDNKAAYSLAVCAVISRANQAIELDLPTTTLEKVGPQIASFLKANLLKKQKHNNEEQHLMQTWTNTIKHSEWDVWNEQEN